jgi:hypothetical protein
MATACERCGLPLPGRAPSCAACGQPTGTIVDAPAGAGSPPRNAWEANAPSGPNRALIGAVLAVPVGLAVLVGLAVVTNWDAFSAGLEAAIQPIGTPRPIGGDPLSVGIGEVVDILDDADAELGSVVVVEASRSVVPEFVAPPGYRYVAARVQYAARTEWTVSSFDWSARDELERHYLAASDPPEPALEGGDLAAGEQATGWLAFLVPADVHRVWLDFVAVDGSVIFTVQIDGPPSEHESPSNPAVPI